MTPWIWALLANAVIALILIILIFVLNKFQKYVIRYLNFLTALTVGILLGMVFLKFLPEILESGMAGTSIGLLILIGLLLFYMMEIFLHFHHCKDLDHDECHHEDVHKHKASSLMNIGTLLHNILHGIVLFSAFSVSVEFGISLTLAILLHSIPQNAANYIMNHKKIKSVLIAAGGGLIGVLILFPFTHFLETHKALILAIIAGGLLYIALSDIFPSLRKSQSGSKKWRGKLIYLLFILLGITAVFLV